MLNIENLNVSIENKEILKDFNLKINEGEVHAIMGPNGTGKSTLSRVIMRDKKYTVEKGTITFENKKILDLSTDKVANLGIFMANQLPCEIDGITTSDFLRTALNYKNENISLYDFIKKVEKASNDLEMKSDMIHRSINKGFSGGEKKKNEILQMKILEPKLIILDEIDSGLDVDSLRIVGENVVSYLNEHPKASVLMITHYPRLLEYIKPDYVHVMVNGNIKESGNYDLAFEIEKNGYDSYKNSSANIVSE
jgi:Fe-S cluster assembly ATP-binding protein